jgi:hypothetical protein
MRAEACNRGTTEHASSQTDDLPTAAEAEPTLEGEPAAADDSAATPDDPLGDTQRDTPATADAEPLRDDSPPAAGSEEAPTPNDDRTAGEQQPAENEAAGPSAEPAAEPATAAPEELATAVAEPAAESATELAAAPATAAAEPASESTAEPATVAAAARVDSDEEGDIPQPSRNAPLPTPSQPRRRDADSPVAAAVAATWRCDDFDVCELLQLPLAALLRQHDDFAAAHASLPPAERDAFEEAWAEMHRVETGAAAASPDAGGRYAELCADLRACIDHGLFDAAAPPSRGVSLSPSADAAPLFPTPLPAEDRRLSEPPSPSRRDGTVSPRFRVLTFAEDRHEPLSLPLADVLTARPALVATLLNDTALRRHCREWLASDAGLYARHRLGVAGRADHLRGYDEQLRHLAWLWTSGEDADEEAVAARLSQRWWVHRKQLEESIAAAQQRQSSSNGRWE